STSCPSLIEFSRGPRRLMRESCLDDVRARRPIYTASVDDQTGVADDRLVVDGGMICDDDDGVLRPQDLLRQGRGFHRRKVWPGAHSRSLRDVRVVVGHLGSQVEEALDDLEGRAL